MKNWGHLSWCALHTRACGDNLGYRTGPRPGNGASVGRIERGRLATGPFFMPVIDEATEKGAAEFKVPANRLMAIRR
jgi:hypothetical protein